MIEVILKGDREHVETVKRWIVEGADRAVAEREAAEAQPRLRLVVSNDEDLEGSA